MSVRNATVGLSSSGPVIISVDTACVVAAWVSTVGIGVVLLPHGPLISVLPAAAVFGMTQIGGRCGFSHVNTMAFFWQKRPLLWLTGTLAYTVAGLLSAAATGAAVGLLGWFAASRGAAPPLMFVAILAVILALRELCWPSLPIPEWKCQTERNWAYTYGWVHASAMWGFHIGLGFFTIITYSGFWVVVAMILAVGKPSYGAAVMTAYWIGRVVPLWVMPPFVRDSKLYATFALPRYRHAQAICLIWCAIVIALPYLLAAL